MEQDEDFIAAARLIHDRMPAWVQQNLRSRCAQTRVQAASIMGHTMALALFPDRMRVK